MLLTLSSIFGLMAALFTVVGTFWALKIASISKEGILKYAFYALLLSNALMIFLSPRDFSDEMALLENPINSNFIANWAIRLTSMLLMLAAIERIIYFFRQNTLDLKRLLFALLIVYVWVTNLVIPNYYIAGSDMKISHFYSLIFGIGIALSLQTNKDTLMLHSRNALILFVILSLLTILVKPNHVLDLSYSQGYIPGLPRFFGLAPHATMMGLLSALAFWLLVTYPLKNQRNHFILLSLMFVSLILSQSKTVLVTFFLGLFIFYLFSKTDSPPPATTYTKSFTKWMLLSIGLVFICLGLLSLQFMDLEKWIYQNISSETIHNLSTLTGRDVISAIALDEFYKSPIFGYGGSLFSPQYRAEIGMLFATHGHNQFIDTLGRAGLIGLSGYIALYSFLAYYSFKFAKRTRGLSLNLFLIIALYSITAIPIIWTQLGPQVLTFFLLLILISSNLDQVTDKEKRR